MKNRLLSTSLQSFKQNLLPGCSLWISATLIVVMYYFFAPAQSFFEKIGELKVNAGFLFSALSTGLFGGIIPFLFLVFTNKIAREKRRQEFLFYFLFWCYKGVEVDAFYRLQGVMFGTIPSVDVIIKKILVDQFIYSPLWGSASLAIFYLWKDLDFSFFRWKENLNREFFTFKLPTVIFSGWMIWIPAVSIVYCLPSALQLPMFNLVLCFWVLILSFISKAEDSSV